MHKKKIIEFIFHIIFWVVTCYFFINNSFLRSVIRKDYYEYLFLIMIICLIYFNLYILIVKFFNKSKFINYFCSLFICTLLITIIEYKIINNDILLITVRLPKKVQIDLQRWNFFGIFFRDSLFVAFFTMFKIYRDAIGSYKLLRDNTVLEKQKLMVEINMLKSKINSHFLFNTLNNLYVMSLKSAPETPEMILNLTDLMDYVVVESEKEIIPIEKEIDFITNYIALERIRHHKLTIEFNYDEELYNIKIAPMIFESFINNAFKYTKNDGTGYVKININCFQDGKVILICENNKLKNNSEVVSRGKGMKNTIERLEMLYKDHHFLNIINDEEIYKAELTLETI